MNRGSKILAVILFVLLGSGIASVLLFTQGSIIGEPTTVSCEWSYLKTENASLSEAGFQSYEKLNQSLKEHYGDNWQEETWGRWDLRKHPETGYIQNKLELDCGYKRLKVNGTQ